MQSSLSPFTVMRAVSRFSCPISRRVVRNRPRFLPLQQQLSSRFSTNIPLRFPPSAKPLTDSPPTSSKGSHIPRPPQPEYQITFTCTPCSQRSQHRISKQGYHHGSVLITCPSCRNRHVISDHLNIFGDRNITIEDLMHERGQLVKKGTLSEDGDLEFWEDGSVTQRGEGAGKAEAKNNRGKEEGAGVDSSTREK